MSVRTLLPLLQRLLIVTFLALVVLDLVEDSALALWQVFLPLPLAWAVSIAAGRLSARHIRAADRAPVEVEPPVEGRWSAVNSPADRTPSHGTHVYGQTYAIDIVAEPEGTERPGFALLWPVARAPHRFPAFGAPLLAVAEATVVHAEDGQRDHLSRNSLLGVAYLMLVEGESRGLAGARRVVGNHVVLDLGDGVHAVYAHVQRGSLAVRAGDRVRPGQVIGRCGNSGNSTEPHLHFHLMDGPDLDTARGIPFSWRGIGVPKGGETFTADRIPGAPSPASPASPAD
ncbi:M23 family metallopeptidase [Streptomyces sp. NPDC050400]|uniref:M23 family metallopeptidase n=1 Tax=Streptomyces sp. NPDC050400 TaxID=3365610 RepID=UPI0037A489E4